MALTFKNATVLLTGASSGMGKLMAYDLAKDAKTLILVARRKDKLQGLAEELSAEYDNLQVLVMPCDLSDMAATKKLISDINAQIASVDILINNAGMGNNNFFIDSDFDQLATMTQLNCLAPTLLARSFLPGMIERRHGGILFVSSMLGKIILPGHAAYCGTKYYLTGLTETLIAEAAGSGVVISGAYPGPVRSDFWKVDNGEIFTPPPFLYWSVEKTARGILRGFKAGRANIIPGLRSKLFLGFIALSPNPIVRVVNSVIAHMMRRKWHKHTNA